MAKLNNYNSIKDIQIFIDNYKYINRTKLDKLQIKNKQKFLKLFKKEYGYFHSNPPIAFGGFKNFAIQDVLLEFV